jgi:type III secretion protein C
MNQPTFPSHARPRRARASRPAVALRSAVLAGLLACSAFAGSADAAQIRWRSQLVHVKVDSKDIKDVLRDFASGQNVPTTVASNINGTVSGDFNMSPQRFLDSLASTFGFVWFYDGSVLSITNANDVTRQVVRLNAASTADLERTLAQMKLDSLQFPITYDESHGTALVSGPTQYVALVAEVARQLDDSSSRRAGSTIRIYHLQHAWAADHKLVIDGTTMSLPGVATTLDSMFHDKKDTSAGDQSVGSGGGMKRMTPLADAGGGTTGGGVMPPLPANGTGGGGAAVGAISAANFPDVGATAGATNGGGSASQKRDTGGAGSKDLPVIIADQRTNSVLIRDLPGRMAQYGPLLDKLDVKPQMIELEAHIIQIDNDAMKQLGVEWHAHNSHVDFQTGNGQTPQNNFTGGSINTVNSSDGTTTAINTTPLGGSLTAVLGDAGRYLLTRVNALEQTNLAKIDASPKVATLDNVEALMNNETRFYVRVSSYTAADLYSVQTGVSLRVLPMLVEENGTRQIKLGVHITDGQLTGQQVDNIPVITSTDIDTEAFLNEGDALLVAGYRVNNATHLGNGVPVLSKIPLLGALFRYRDDEDSTMERLFLITPRVINLDFATSGNKGPTVGAVAPARPAAPGGGAPSGSSDPALRGVPNAVARQRRGPTG